MSEESKEVVPPSEVTESKDEATATEPTADNEVDAEDAEDTTTLTTTTTGGSSSKSKKKNKKKKASAEDEDAGEGSSNILNEPVGKLNKGMIEKVMKSNASLGADLQGMDPKKIQELLKGMKLEDLMTGMASGGKNAKDMANYKFWQTQPVARFDEDIKEEGEIKKGVLELVPKEPSALLDSFEWVVMDLSEEKQLDEVYELLTGHYVEDDEAMFRFNYSGAFLNWALKSPGWRKDWHIGVRVKASQKLVAFISGIPVDLRVRAKTLKCSEINFLCVHKKLRSKRLAPVMIKEITRRCHLVEIWQAIYTGGVVLPTPVSSCRYYHRSLDWLKLNEVGFSPLPAKSTKARQITKYALPRDTSTAGLRIMESKDVPHVQDLLKRYLSRFDLAPIYSEEEVDHWLLHKDGEQVIWTYVVEDPETNKITDFFSFYALESSVINNKKYDTIRAAYMFYYATEAAFNDTKSQEETKAALKTRLNELVHDALILAKRFNFDVFNALTLLDNNLFLADQKFGAGDGQLHFYLYNYRTAPIAGGLDEKSYVNEKTGSGIGMVML